MAPNVIALALYPFILIVLLSPIFFLLEHGMGQSLKRAIATIAWLYIITQTLYIWILVETYK